MVSTFLDDELARGQWYMHSGAMKQMERTTVAAHCCGTQLEVWLLHGTRHGVVAGLMHTQTSAVRYLGAPGLRGAASADGRHRRSCTLLWHSVGDMSGFGDPAWCCGGPNSHLGLKTLLAPISEYAHSHRLLHRP